MIVRGVVCPICGNDIHVNNVREVQKCEFCRRPISVTFEKRKSGGKTKWKVSVEPAPFEPDHGRSCSYKKIKNLSKFREEEIYGVRHSGKGPA